jgi:hypothetical protein
MVGDVMFAGELRGASGSRIIVASYITVLAAHCLPY